MAETAPSQAHAARPACAPSSTDPADSRQALAGLTRVEITNLDHVTIVVAEVAPAKRFFALLGFVEDRSVVIRGEPFASYMGIAGLEAEHHTLVLAGATPRLEVQLLRLLQPAALANPDLATLRQRGFNHLCLATDDLAGEVARLGAAGIHPR